MTPATTGRSKYGEKYSSAEISQGIAATIDRPPLTIGNSLGGSRVKNTNDNYLGRIKDLARDPENGRVAYVIVFVAHKEIAVPLSAIRLDPQTDLKPQR